jgi:SAM-dependent methyltransferase
VLVARPVVLEAGCGRTTRLVRYRHRIRRLVGVDLDVAAGEENRALDEFVPADASGPLPFAPGSFDVVYANCVVEHLPRPAVAFREWRRLLTPGGSLVLTTSNLSNPVMRVAHALPQRPMCRSNTVSDLDRDLTRAGFAARQVSGVATIHRYAGGHRRLAGALQASERLLPAERRSTLVAWYQAA